MKTIFKKMIQELKQKNNLMLMLDAASDGKGKQVVKGLLYFALTCGISYMLSGYNGLYSSQTILYSKLKAQYINVKTNDHHEGKPHAQPLDKGSLKE